MGSNAYWAWEVVGVARVHRGTQQGSQGRQLLKHHVGNRCSIRYDRLHLHRECKYIKTSPGTHWCVSQNSILSEMTVSFILLNSFLHQGINNSLCSGKAVDGMYFQTLIDKISTYLLNRAHCSFLCKLHSIVYDRFYKYVGETHSQNSPNLY